MEAVETVGLIGLGTMGIPMVKRLLSAGISVRVWGRKPEAIAAVTAHGARAVHSLADLAAQTSVIILMVSDDEAVRRIVFSPEGFGGTDSTAKIVINCSTVGPDTSRTVNSYLADHGIDFLEAPVTGSQAQAEQGTLNFLVGGKMDVLEHYRPLLETMGKNIFYLGEVGTASVAKLASNTIVALNLVALMEGISIVREAGIDIGLFTHILQQGGARSAILDAKRAKLLEHDFRPQFSVQWMLKDLRLAADLGNRLGAPSVVLEKAVAVFQMGMDIGIGDEDVSGIVRCYDAKKS